MVVLPITQLCSMSWSGPLQFWDKESVSVSAGRQSKGIDPYIQTFPGERQLQSMWMQRLNNITTPQFCNSNKSKHTQHTQPFVTVLATRASPCERQLPLRSQGQCLVLASFNCLLWHNLNSLGQRVLMRNYLCQVDLWEYLWESVLIVNWYKDTVPYGKHCPPTRRGES